VKPEPTRDEPIDFDSYPGDYDSALARGIRVSGENKIYFARERIAWLAKCLEKLHMHPRSVLDFGCGIGSSTRFFLDLLGGPVGARSESVGSLSSGGSGGGGQPPSNWRAVPVLCRKVSPRR